MIALPKAPFLSATTQIVANGTKPAIPACAVKFEKITVSPKKTFKSNYSLSKTMVKSAPVAVNGLTGPMQIRLVHTDVKVPNFDYYRRTGTKDATKKSDADVLSGQMFSYLVLGGGALTGVYAGKTIVNQLISTLSMSADVLALAKIEVKLDDIPEGKNAIFKWRGKPLFVRHRTAEEIETEQAVNLAELRDPQHDSDRVQRPEWLVLIGVCTHLGCVPIGCAGDYGGYFCPCHGSHYDTSGRIRKGPAPLNLEVPVHSFAEDDLLIVG